MHIRADPSPPSLVGLSRALLELGFQSGFASALFVCGFQPLLGHLLTGAANSGATVAMLALVWQIYLLDRLQENAEDTADDAEHPAAFARRFRAPLLCLVACLAGLELYLMWATPWLVGAIAISTAASAFYLVPLPFVGKRAKEIPYLKCFYLSGVCIASLLAFTPGWRRAEPALLAKSLSVAFALYFLNFSLYDVKDLEQDRRANIKTLAASVPLPRFLALHIVSAVLVALVAPLALPAPLSLALSAVAAFHALVSAWLTNHRFSSALCGLIDTGYGLITGIGTFWLLHR
jgi:4-hydroxybenzoate polyprenyltransferase